MADRTWNQTDARLYDEEWSAGAIIVANCLLTRCPNTYGVFDMPWGFLIRFFQGIFTAMEIRAFVQELEAGEPEKRFMTLYRDRSVVWIRSKWKRAGKPSPLHWKGLENHLADFPEVSIDFKAYYNLYWESIQSPLKGDSKGIKGGSIPPVNPDSESESESESEKEKRREEKKDSANADDFDPELAALVLELFPIPEFQGWTQAQRTKQVDALDKLTTIDKFPRPEVFAVLRWMRTDDFWNPVFQSIPRLREDGQKKYRSAKAQWERRNGKLPLNKRLDDDTKWANRPTGEVKL